MKKNKHRKEIHPHTSKDHCQVFQNYKTSLPIIWCSFVSDLQEETWTESKCGKVGWVDWQRIKI